MREQSVREVDATPYAASLIEGHRDFGYNLETSLADIIDNAITAGARRVELIANTVVDEPWIALADDGSGMAEATLVEAMRLGSKNPTDKREAEDLGRFGLGLKSASFSQCRSLTVLTRQDGRTSCARWSLDRVAKRNDWSLEHIDNPKFVTGHDLLSETGTVVIWEKLDRLSGGYTHDRAKRAEHMNSELSRAERHLRLVFHRFLEGAKPRLKLSLNGRQLKPIDPMAMSHAATQKDPEEVLRSRQGDVLIRCHTLPHHKRMSREEWEEIGGPEGHRKSQGLYVYREKRLIIAGGWLGLTRQTELTKLCRIAVDIGNSSVKKTKTKNRRHLLKPRDPWERLDPDEAKRVDVAGRFDFFWVVMEAGIPGLMLRLQSLPQPLPRLPKLKNLVASFRPVSGGSAFVLGLKEKGKKSGRDIRDPLPGCR